MDSIERAIELKEELEALRPLSPEDELRIMQKFRLDWNYHSNHLEGNTLTFGETKALLLHGITAQGKPLKYHFEITGHNEAIEWVIEVVKGDRPLTENFIRELHKLILKEPYEVDALTPDGKPTKKRVKVGQYKTTPNHVKTRTGEIFRFATPEETPAKMADLVAWYRKEVEDGIRSPIILAAAFHYKYIRIHPFDDGNGRTARILMNFILMSFGFPPVVIKTEDKANYFSVLEQADGEVIEPFFEYIAGNLVTSLELMIRGAKGESLEEPEDIVKEIALLDQRLKRQKEKIELLKNQEIILSVFDAVFAPLVEKLWEKGSLFNKYYLSNSIGLAVGSKGQKSENFSPTFLEELRNEINDRVESMRVEYNHNNFNYKGKNEFHFISDFRVKFSQTKYTVTNIEIDKSIEKYYSDLLTKEEIESLVSSEMNRHLELLNKHLDGINEETD